ncbi:uncharacterized protein VTP21DRAFT_9424 [Calcarisporiella thermophila]|uniref:uncharacterized protein n=1 Tax=Calcarisporiella thermophila TaxID=911321 RepID=UPI003743B04C
MDIVEGCGLGSLHKPARGSPVLQRGGLPVATDHIGDIDFVGPDDVSIPRWPPSKTRMIFTEAAILPALRPGLGRRGGGQEGLCLPSAGWRLLIGGCCEGRRSDLFTVGAGSRLAAKMAQRFFSTAATSQEH